VVVNMGWLGARAEDPEDPEGGHLHVEMRKAGGSLPTGVS
jgi:hypothetical protein